jgi:hypothetical protein
MEKRKTRFLNTTSPCNPEDHYMLPPEERLVGTQLHRYIGDKLYWVLHALRDGFASRGVGKFPVSIALVGMRDLSEPSVRDYITASKVGIPVNPGSPFNIKANSRTLSNFQKDDISRLFSQRTAETEQPITPEARETHLDTLAYCLENPQIRSVMESLITGEPDTRLAAGELFRLCLDLGLVTIEKGRPAVAKIS